MSRSPKRLWATEVAAASETMFPTPAIQRSTGAYHQLEQPRRVKTSRLLMSARIQNPGPRG